MIGIKPNYLAAVENLVGEDCGGLNDGPVSGIMIPSGATPPTEEAIQAKLAELISDWNALEYSRKRRKDYPEMGVQLEKIYDDGLTKWKSEMVDPVKTKWPKDNSGPV